MINGQLSLFDFFDAIQGAPQRPCDYSFKRYVGQRIRIMFGTYGDNDVREGIIKKIVSSYFTVVIVDGKEYVGTPYNLREVTE